MKFSVIISSVFCCNGLFQFDMGLEIIDVYQRLSTMRNPVATDSKSQCHISFREIFRLYWNLLSSHTQILGKHKFLLNPKLTLPKVEPLQESGFRAVTVSSSSYFFLFSHLFVYLPYSIVSESSWENSITGFIKRLLLTDILFLSFLLHILKIYFEK